MKCANELTWQESLESCSLNGKNDLGSSGTHFCKEEKEFIPPYWLFIFVFLNLKQTFERSFLVYQKTGICLRLTLKNGKDEERRGTGKGAVTLKLPLNIQLSSTAFTVSEQNVQYVDHNHRSVHTHYLKNFHKPNRWTEDQRSEIISDYSPPVSSVHGIFQGAKMKAACECVLSRSVVSDSVAPWTVAHQATLPMEFSRQEYWISLNFHCFQPDVNCDEEPRVPEKPHTTHPYHHQQHRYPRLLPGALIHLPF
ncbi:hypothetical protein MG293_000472 [Ovis ammon polii]|uniref:Uncharacterized protein n=1 Tax=Ovis ammon polii TaxID=230172 RepID=A0AAD4YI20_OVIAM|nr:hypothetical protein MG293_000472 [Ovis ammon polii]